MILVVEDHGDTAQALIRLLAKAGQPALAMSCGEDLLTYLKHTIPDLVVLDLSMPGIGGLQCLQIIRSTEAWRNIPVIVFTADYNFDRLNEARQLGVQGFLVKGTVSWDKLLEIVEKALKSRSETQT